VSTKVVINWEKSGVLQRFIISVTRFPIIKRVIRDICRWKSRASSYNRKESIDYRG